MVRGFCLVVVTVLVGCVWTPAAAAASCVWRQGNCIVGPDDEYGYMTCPAGSSFCSPAGIHLQQLQQRQQQQQQQQQQQVGVSSTAAAAAAAGSDVEAQHGSPGASTRVVYKVLTTPRVRGSRMRLNATLAKQKARACCEYGVPLWRHLMSASSRSSSNGSSSSSSSRVKLSPKQLKAKLQEFRLQSDGDAAYLDNAENRNLALHLQALLQLLSPHDDPLLIGADIVTDRLLVMERLSGGRVTSANNAFSAVRCAFRLLFGRCLQPGIEAPLTTVKVGGDKLRIDLHSPLPDATVTEFKTDLALRGSLMRDAQGTIRTMEAVQLQMAYALTQLLENLEGLKHWRGTDFIPPRALEQVNRWAMLVLALLFRVLCNERPSDISLYHLGCFKLQAPDHSSTNLAALALAALQPDAAHSADQMLEAFRAAGAVLLIKAPKCKQSYDVRHSVQKCAVQCGVRLAVSAQLASHSTEEALKYAANSCYEAVASTGTPIKLASPEWREGQLPPELQPGSSIAGVPLDVDIAQTTTRKQWI
ncbi:hypothetical protein OEZ86_004494 [Tetradesmus obliquus]|nr:hypothetical protein OEZ86_004494 [Tetradesmus obliquus]